MTRLKPKKMSMSGFTLIEMIVVIIIIAVLAGIGIPQYLKVVEKSRAAEAIRLLGAIKQAEDRYFATVSKFQGVRTGGFGDAANRLDISTGTLKYFDGASVAVKTAAGAEPAATGDEISDYMVRIVRNATDFTGLSTFASGYEVQMSSAGAILNPPQLR